MIPLFLNVFGLWRNRILLRTIDKHGQQLLVPEIEIEGWWTSLVFDEETIIALYADHGTSEQYHSEFKTDLDIERLPSGKFATNALILACAQLAYNILRWIGQNGLLGPDAPPRHRAKRRRIRTVMQELMYLAARLIHTGQHYDRALSESFIVDMGLGVPDVSFGVGGATRGEQIGRAVQLLDEAFAEPAIEAVVVQGDTNTTVAGALAAFDGDVPDRDQLEQAFRRMSLDHRTVIVHFANSTEEQIDRIARMGCIVSTNPYYPVGFADKFGEVGLGRGDAALLEELVEADLGGDHRLDLDDLGLAGGGGERPLLRPALLEGFGPGGLEPDGVRQREESVRRRQVRRDDVLDPVNNKEKSIFIQHAHIASFIPAFTYF